MSVACRACKIFFWSDLEIVCAREPAGEASRIKQQLLDLYCPVKDWWANIGAEHATPEGTVNLGRALGHFTFALIGLKRILFTNIFRRLLKRHLVTVIGCCSSPEQTRRLFATLGLGFIGFRVY